ncbi:adenylate/guanylate cyclase domain-containing protein [Actinoplanes sp. NEAU-A12]|uniref:Adenylate/guanylate cyclase domain-containing protein n=1 Tax=Actinoplanes sandaracinus TaxID=3045177 RepID=A0ABT6WJF8_9ACTN|nr:adenylate/guanylate cyclase domain-containing protein [Actinoplanes sandaracinus]MDI6099874.1 adenylate/guanylate cyclase domain-containing protein [Actinoplanes sandaracinus]
MSGRIELPSGLVTFMFTDIEGSTRLARMLGETYRNVLGAHRAVLRAVFDEFRGVELLTEGDSFFVAFSHADAAVAACVEAQRRLASYDWPRPDAVPRVRIGLHTGRAVPVGQEYASAEVHRAARVSAAAHGGQVLCSEATALAVTAAYAATSGGSAGAAAAATLATVDLLDLGAFRLRGFDDDERLFQVTAPGLDRDFPRPRTAEAPRHNLPAEHSPFVGRRAELADLAELISHNRLVTVVGPGGSGKTRLTHAVAEQLLKAYPGGVWSIDAAVAAQGLPTALAAALGLRPEPGRPMIDTVVEQCAERRMLVLLQTCDAAPALTAALAHRLLSRCRRLDVVATGRAPLALAGETVWRLPPLAPADAFALLRDRAAAAQGGRPGDGDPQLARLAARLEGSPLAIQLAAARLRLLPAEQLARRLDDPLGALDNDAAGDGRHASLTNNLAWSYRTLGSRAADLLRRLAAFAGPVELATVEWCDPEALGALSELADKSLVEVVPGPRYRMSDQVRAYALRQLSSTGDEPVIRDRHLAWSLHTLDRVTVDTDGQVRTVSLTELSPYVAEWQAALRWAAATGDVSAGLRLAVALDPWWREHGDTRDGRELLSTLYRRLPAAGTRRVASEPGTPAEAGSVVAVAESVAACLVWAGLTGDRAERERLLARAEAEARGSGDPALLVRVRAARLTLPGDDPGATERDCREVVAQAERTGVPNAAFPAVLTLAELLWRREALAEASDLLGAARHLEAARPEDRGRRAVDWLLGMVALRRGDLVAAHDHLVVALRSRLRHGFRGAAADAVAAIAVRCALGGDPATATVLFGGAEAARGARRTESFGAFWSAHQTSLRAAMGDVTFDAAYADGAGLGFDRIVAMALAVEHPDLEDGAARFAQIAR